MDSVACSICACITWHLHTYIMSVMESSGHCCNTRNSLQFFSLRAVKETREVSAELVDMDY